MEARLRRLESAKNGKNARCVGQERKFATMPFTHQDLCSLAVNWLQRASGRSGPACQVAFSEAKGGWNRLERRDPGCYRIQDGSGRRRLGRRGSEGQPLRLSAGTAYRQELLADIERSVAAAFRRVGVAWY